MPEAAAAKPRRRALRWLVIAALVVGALVLAANLYLIAATRAAIVPDVAAAPRRPHVIVLGNRVFPGGRPSAELAARLETALAVYQAGRGGKVIVSGMVHGDYDEPHAMAAWLQARGVPAEDVVLDLGGRRTAATMADAAALGVRSALIVTQGYHLPRALYLARHAGIDALGVAAPNRHERWPSIIKFFCRETAARAETLVEVALRGVH
jgi:SanA protein